tara:strand:- start:498 stop:623 length:126 start_codon:yes stop_codon:yes gene_type:complete
MVLLKRMDGTTEEDDEGDHDEEIGLVYHSRSDKNNPGQDGR